MCVKKNIKKKIKCNKYIGYYFECPSLITICCGRFEIAAKSEWVSTHLSAFFGRYAQCFGNHQFRNDASLPALVRDSRAYASCPSHVSLYAGHAQSVLREEPVLENRVSQTISLCSSKHQNISAHSRRRQADQADNALSPSPRNLY